MVHTAPGSESGHVRNGALRGVTARPGQAVEVVAEWSRLRTSGSDPATVGLEGTLRSTRAPAPATPPPAGGRPRGDAVGGVVADPYWRLRFLATSYAFIVPVRGMGENRRRATRQTRGELDEGLRRIQGWFDQLLDVGRLTEREIQLELVREYRRVAPVSVRTWQRATQGIGELGLARLLGHIGHPVHTVPYRWEGDGPDRRLVAGTPFDRKLRQLWAYCGHGWSGRQRQRPMSHEELLALGHPVAKSVVRWMAECCQRQVEARFRTPRGVLAHRPASPYRAVYEDARRRYDGHHHDSVCYPCGPRGRPAPAGSPWTANHQHGAALRLVAKTILRDLWTAAR